jgi:chromate transporter
VPVALATVLREWGRIGVVGFGGPPAHIALLRELCVERREWLDAEAFEDDIAACNLLPGPASTQLAIVSAWRVAGPRGSLVGGLAFILPGLVAILALAAVFLGGGVPLGLRAAAAGAGAAVAAVAVHAAWSLAPSSWRRAADRRRWAAYALAGVLAGATAGPWVVLVLLACGALEVVAAGRARGVPGAAAVALPFAAASVPALSWTAFKVGALSYGGGFVIVPLMQDDAVRSGWMTAGEFLNAVALGQVTPGPVTHTVSAVGFAAAGLGGALLAAAVAFAPSFVFVLAGARRFDRLRADPTARAFLGGAGPAAVGAILGAAVALARLLQEPWQAAVLVVALVALLGVRLGVVPTLLAAAAAGIACGVAGLPVPGG